MLSLKTGYFLVDKIKNYTDVSLGTVIKPNDLGITSNYLVGKRIYFSNRQALFFKKNLYFVKEGDIIAFDTEYIGHDEIPPYE